MYFRGEMTADFTVELPFIFGLSYVPLYNSHVCRTARNLRKSPIYQQLRDAGGVFGEIMGYERPLYFVPESEKCNIARL